MNYRVINHEQKSIHLNITAHLSGLAVEAVFLDPLTLFSLFLSLILLSLHVHKASVCVCVCARACVKCMVRSIWASSVSAVVFWQTFFPLEEH